MRAATALRWAAACIAAAMLLALTENAASAHPERLRFFWGVDLLAALPLSLTAALLGALRPRPCPWPWTLAALSLLVGALLSGVAVFAGGVDSGLQTATQWRRASPLPYLRADDARPIVLISVDTWRHDSLEHMPLLAARAQNAAHYTRARSTAPWTLPSMASLVTGQSVHSHGAGRRAHAVETGVRSGIQPNLPLLGESLQDRGYVTVGVLSNPYLGASLGFHRGLDRVSDATREALMRDQLRESLLLRALLPPVGDDAESQVDRALQRWGRIHEGQGFLWVHLVDAHVPYGGPREGCHLPDCFPSWVPVRRGEADPDRDHIESLYRRDLSALDAALDRLLTQVQSEDTLVILVGDHGEAFGPGTQVEHGHSFHDPVMRVPLLIWGPGVQPGEIGRPVDLRTVHDALLDYADTGALAALDPGLPGVVTPMASLLYGPEGSACSDGWNTVQDRGQGPEAVEGQLTPELVGCLPGPLPLATGALEIDAALRSLGYVD